MVEQKEREEIHIEKVDNFRWRIPRQGKMRTEGLVYADEAMLKEVRKDQSLKQVANVAWLPGIIGCSLAMPDIHWGYGFPIGGVAAFEVKGGVVSPGGVGYDINCGVRLLSSGLNRKDIEHKVREIIEVLFANIPTGVGSARKDFKLNREEEEGVLSKGAAWAVARGFGEPEDLYYIEEGGCIPGADPAAVSQRARERGRPQLGTLGSGNHFVEVGYVEEVYDEGCAEVLGLYKDQVTVFIHTGSRGLGHQVCDDAIKVMLEASRKYQIELPDRQLCCAPVDSREGRNYLSAMACAANYAFVNRQMITHWVRESFEEVFKKSFRELQLNLVYDVCHNIAKIETHNFGGEERSLCVHRKGATRAFPPYHQEVPEKYKVIGQPVLIPGDMGRCSYVLVGTERAFQETFGSTCHGAGRVLSRHEAMRVARGRSILKELESQGIYVRASSGGTVVEEMPDAYKDVSRVVDIVDKAGISKKVVKLRPMGVIKG